MIDFVVFIARLIFEFRDTILYGRDTHTLEEVYESLRLKETMKQLVNRYEAKAKGLISKEGFTKKVSRIVTKVDQSPKLETSLIRKRGMLLMIVIGCRKRIRSCKSKRKSTD